MVPDQKNITPKCILVLGGAASGKSEWAEALTIRLSERRLYVATAEAWDDEMREKLRLHRARRDASWRTLEAPLDVAGALADAGPGEAVLLDCATMWLTNVILGEHDLAAAEAELLQGLRACRAPVVIVSNEIGMGVVPDNALSRRFREAQGRLNQRLAGEATQVVAVMAGLPLALKGPLP